jgi:putative ABC transport system permease protein
MHQFSELWRRLAHLFGRQQWDADLAEEMQLHINLRAESNSQSSARRSFGNVSRLREESRAAWGWTLLDSLLQDLRYGMRALAGAPGFTAAAVLSLALGIGANTAIFSILNAVMLRSLPVEDPTRLVELQSNNRNSFTNPAWEQVRDRKQLFAGTLAFYNTRFDLAEGGESHFANGMWVNGDFFRVLGVNTLRGRTIIASDDVHGGGPAGPVAVISYAFWKGHFGGDPNVLGKSVKLDRHTFQIVGITPAWFKGLDVDQSYDVAIPIGCEPLLHTDKSWLSLRSTWWLRIIGRLPPGETLERAQARLSAAALEINRASLPLQWDVEHQKEYLKRSLSLKPAATGFSDTRDQYQTALFTLMTVVGLVLLIACANVANLLLARAAARQREISIRLAIGAARGRIIRQLLTESILLALLGAAAGLAFSLWGSRLLVRMLSTAGAELKLDVAPDLPVFLFTAAISLLTGILFGLAPALRSTRSGPDQVLKEHARGAISGASRFTLGKVLVTGQVALSLVLVAGAGLFVGSLRNLLAVDAGFNPRNILLAEIGVTPSRVPKPLRIALFQTVLARLQAIPGVRSAASSFLTPVSHSTWNEVVHPEGYNDQAKLENLVYLNRVSPDYFQTMGTPLLNGRIFSNRDTLAAPKVIVISEYTARHFWGAANPLGKTIGMEKFDAPTEQDLYQVVGLVKDIKYETLDEKPLMTGYVPASQDPDPRPGITYALRFDGSLQALTPAIRAAVGAVDPGISLTFRSFETQIEDSLMQPRLVALLSSFFGFLALLLAMVGLYGLISYSATRRSAEIGIRIALGAQARAVVWLVLRDVVVMLAGGVLLGLAGSLAAGRLITSLLFGMHPTDPTTIASAAILLCAAALLAGYLPARRAAGIDPMRALREE